MLAFAHGENSDSFRAVRIDVGQYRMKRVGDCVGVPGNPRVIEVSQLQQEPCQYRLPSGASPTQELDFPFFESDFPVFGNCSCSGATPNGPAAQP